MKKGEKCSGSVGHVHGVGLSGFLSQAEPRPKAACSGMFLRVGREKRFRLEKKAWEVSQRPSLFSPFFISTAIPFTGALLANSKEK
ncbi:hypothetical protein I532_19107 [Brevibacillus borstelensis AK1]|jgi:hypothetical protein|uniref:Uncharacterized protein n=1 Tax=Brevibacillus borstelensis AK1 TaxID=1300222 RepID=M8DVP3_9BACL|nr:hypothetical protein I532_19107 [Brevibacillus borstelensis AK1]